MPEIKWTKEKVFEESKKYKYRSEFRKYANRASVVARNNGWLDEMDWFITKSNPYVDSMHCIYGYFDEENKVAYIGLTIRKTERKLYHSKEGPVYRYFISIDKPIPDPVYIEDGLNYIEAQEKENYYIEFYKKEGYTLLNKAKAGVGSSSLGGMVKKWTKPKTLEESKKYSSLTEFARECGPAYTAARRYGWLKDMTWLGRKHRDKWTLEEIKEEAKKFGSKSEFRKFRSGAYDAILRNGWMNKIEWPVIKKDTKVKTKPHAKAKSKINPSEIFERYTFKGDPSNKDDVYAFLQVETSNGALKKEFIFAKCFPEIYKDIRSKEWDTDISFSQILYNYFNPEITGRCKVCNKSTRYRSFKDGYAQYCCAKCTNSDPDKKLKTIQTVQEKYGVDNVFKNEDVKKNIKATNQKKYGFDYAAQSKEVKDKQKATCIEKYGVPTPFQMKDFQEKSIQTCREKYGYDHASQSPEVKAKVSSTYKDKTGYENPSHNPEVIDKRRETNFKNNYFLDRHKNIIGETDSTYIVECNDDKCTLCENKSFEIDKTMYKQLSQVLTMCPIKSSYVETE